MTFSFVDIPYLRSKSPRLLVGHLLSPNFPRRKEKSFSSIREWNRGLQVGRPELYPLSLQYNELRIREDKVVFLCSVANNKCGGQVGYCDSLRLDKLPGTYLRGIQIVVTSIFMVSFLKQHFRNSSHSQALRIFKKCGIMIEQACNRKCKVNKQVPSLPTLMQFNKSIFLTNLLHSERQVGDKHHL